MTDDQAGCRWTAHSNLTLLGAVGRGIKDPEEGTLELIAYVGVQVLLGKQAPEGRATDTMD